MYRLAMLSWYRFVLTIFVGDTPQSPFLPIPPIPSSPLKRGPVLVHQVESLAQLLSYSLLLSSKSPVSVPLAHMLTIVWLAKTAAEKKAPTQVSLLCEYTTQY